MLHKAHIAGMAMDPNSNTPIVLLRSESSNQIVPIWIGLLEATAIASALKDVAFERPMTHDLFKNFADELKIRIDRIEVTDIRENTYYALIHFESEAGRFIMDSRPSDALALALRFKAPIFIEEKVFEKSKPLKENGEAIDESEEGRKWAEYLSKLSPEDFGKYKM